MAVRARLDRKRRLWLITGAALVLLLLGLLLLLVVPDEEDRVRLALDQLVLAAERRDPPAVGEWIDDAYDSLAGPKEIAVGQFEAAITVVTSLNIKLRDVNIVIQPEGETADVMFDWAYTAVFDTEFGRLDTSFFDDNYEPAKCVFRKAADGRWLLLEADTRVRPPKPPGRR